MRYESFLASRYIKAQKRQSVFTAVSIAAAVAVIMMVFILYSVCINCLRNTYYSAGAYHLIFAELTEEQGEALADRLLLVFFSNKNQMMSRDRLAEEL